MIDLQECRKEIDRIDAELLRLFEKRMKVCEDVAEYKIHTGKKGAGSETGACENCGFDGTGARRIQQARCAGAVSADYGNQPETPVSATDKNGIEENRDYEMEERLPLEDVHVVFQGVEGAYSYAAMRAYFEDNIHGYHVKTWRDAMEEVSFGRADYAVLPIENSTAGIVADIYDLLAEYQLYIVGEQPIRVDHVLLGLPGAKLEELRTVCSHPQGSLSAAGIWRDIPGGRL